MTTEPTAAAPPTAPQTRQAFPRRPASDPRRWIAFGTGVGIDLRDGELHAVIARVRPSGAAISGALTIPEFRNQPAAEWGRTVTEFLRRNSAGHIAATVLLPRHETIVRLVSLPGVTDRDLKAAVQLQLDSLHPFGEDDVYFSWSRVGKSTSVLVGIVRRDVLDQHAALMAEAGVKVSAFTFSAAALYSALRTLHAPSAEFLLAQPGPSDVEVYGESPSRPVYSAALPVSPERAASVARSELRLAPETEAWSLAEALPRPTAVPRGLDSTSETFAAFQAAYAAALTSACPTLAIEGNLLPAERRRASSRIRLIPTFALAGTLAVLVGLLAIQSSWADRRYLGILQHEISRYEPAAKRLEGTDRAIVATRARSQMLDDFRKRAKQDMDTLAEVTKLVPPPSWVSNMDMDRNTLIIAGEAESAAPLLEAFDKSPLFSRSEFTIPMTRNGQFEMYRLKTQRDPEGAAK